MNRSVACIDYRNGKVFIAKRLPGGAMGERWEFPGGKMEEGETFEVAIKREMQEEFGVEVKVGSHITDGKFLHNDKERTLSVYEITILNADNNQKFPLTEHSEYKWVELDEITKLNFVDSDLQIYPEVKKWCEGKK